MWYIKLHVREVISSMLAEPADMLQLEFGYIKRKIPISENIVEWRGTSNNIEWDILD